MVVTVAYTMLVTPVYLIFFGMEHAVRVEAESLWTTIVVILWCEPLTPRFFIRSVSATCSHCHGQRIWDRSSCVCPLRVGSIYPSWLLRSIYLC